MGISLQCGKLEVCPYMGIWSWYASRSPRCSDVTVSCVTLRRLSNLLPSKPNCNNATSEQLYWPSRSDIRISTKWKLAGFSPCNLSTTSCVMLQWFSNPPTTKRAKPSWFKPHLSYLLRNGLLKMLTTTPAGPMVKLICFDDQTFQLRSIVMTIFRTNLGWRLLMSHILPNPGWFCILRPTHGCVREVCTEQILPR